MPYYPNPSGVYVPITGIVSKTGLISFRDGIVSRPITGDAGGGYTSAKELSDLSQGVFNWRHNGDFGYLFHLGTGPTYNQASSAVALIGLGVGDGDGSGPGGYNEGGVGLLVSNKKSGVGVRIIQNSTVDDIAAYGLYLTQSSTFAPGMLLQQTADGVKPLIRLITSSTPTASQNLVEWFGSAGTQIGSITAAGTITTIATTALQIGNAASMRWLDSGATARRMFQLDSSNVLRIGDIDNALTTGNVAIAAGGSGSTIVFTTNGGTRLTLDSNGLTIPDNRNLVLGTATGSMVATTSSQLLGFWGKTPIVRPSAYTQTYATADKVHAARLATAVVTTPSTNVTPYGFTQSQADDMVAQINNLRSDQLDTAQVLNALLDDLQLMGLAS